MIHYRRTWVKFHGIEIPKGWHIHHRDGDKNNHNISNLVACPIKAHASLHHYELKQNGIANYILKKGKYVPTPDERKAQSLRAKEWHKCNESPKGMLGKRNPHLGRFNKEHKGVNSPNYGRKRADLVLRNKRNVGDKHPSYGKPNEGVSEANKKRADSNMYWFKHDLYGLVKCTRQHLANNFNKPWDIKALFYTKPQHTVRGWSLA